jgi:hypothetical protein
LRQLHPFTDVCAQLQAGTRLKRTVLLDVTIKNQLITGIRLASEVVIGILRSP